MSSVFKKIFTHSFWRFSVIGAINTAIDFGVFLVLHFIFDWGVISANVMAFLFAATNSYFLNKHWAFEGKDESKFETKQFIFFVAVSLFSLTLGTSILVLGQPYISILILKPVSAVFTPLLNYIFYRYVIFSPSTK